MRKTMLLLAAVLALAAGCAGKKAGNTKQLTERQRDSVLAGESAIPGASAVGAAMKAGDHEADRAASLNAAVDSLPR